MIGLLVLFLQQRPDEHYAGGASSQTAGTTALAGHVFRFLFSTVPQWVQLAGIFIGVPVALIVAWQVWRHRRAIWAWWVARTRILQVAIVGAAFVVALVAAGSGLYGYNYVMHQNDFCQSCHIMDVPWNRFQVSAHKALECHACHRQPLYFSSVELFYWLTERRMAVPVHDRVPTAVCGECHMRKGTDSARTLVTLTAGHVVHLESDSAALKNVECVTCHGRDFHRFTPTNSSCAQSGCHTNTRVQLGAMSRQGFLHCTTCHDFRSTVAPGVTVAQARGKLGPKALDCGMCHAMTEKIAKYDLAADPHKGNCGMCHDVHKQTEPKDAFKTCANAQCHASADTLTAFHRGLGGHAIDQCGACHRAHSWKVNGTNCLACHKTINQDRPTLRRTSSLVVPAASHRSVPWSWAAPGVVRLASFGALTAAAPWRVPRRTFAPAPVARGPRAPPPDSTFKHSTHKSIACTDCHGTTNVHGGLKFAAPAGCIGCHHGAKQRAQCSTCHAAASLGHYTVPVAFVITPRRAPVTRTLPFAHAQHTTLACARCHASDAKQSVTTKCTSCHADHHGARSDCASCHPSSAARTGHDRTTAHEACAGCHTDAAVSALGASRPICLACHQEQRSHYPTGDCATCHAVTGSATVGAGAGRTEYNR
jgi:hypothetical protein